MLALDEIRLGCLGLLGQAETLVTAILAKATGDVLCALLCRFFGIYTLARLSIAVTLILVSVMKKRINHDIRFW